jgi:hypothetical protein
LIVEIALGVFAGLALFHYRAQVVEGLSNLFGIAIVGGIALLIIVIVLGAPVMLLNYGMNVPDGEKPGISFSIGLLWIFFYGLIAWNSGWELLLKKFPILFKVKAKLQEDLWGKRFYNFWKAVMFFIMIFPTMVPGVIAAVLLQEYFKIEALSYFVLFGLWICSYYLAVKYWLKTHPYSPPVPNKQEKAS